MDITELGFQNADSIDPFQSRIQWQALLNIVISDSIKGEEFFTR